MTLLVRLRNVGHPSTVLHLSTHMSVIPTPTAQLREPSRTWKDKFVHSGQRLNIGFQHLCDFPLPLCLGLFVMQHVSSPDVGSDLQVAHPLNL